MAVPPVPSGPSPLDRGSELDTTDVDLVTLARQELDRTRALAPGLDVGLSAPESLVVRADAFRLAQVLANLTDNARQAIGPAGWVHVSVAQAERAATVTVVDDGPGIAPPDRERVFERFTRLDASRSRRTGGAGPGLAISRALARAHGGDLTATARPDGRHNPEFMTRPQPFWEVSEAGFRDVVDTNLTGCFLVTSALVHDLLPVPGGRLLDVSMNHATMTRAGFVPHGPSRAGTESLSRAMAVDLAGTTVMVNLILPGGATLTGMLPDSVTDTAGLLPADVMAAPVRWLCSPAVSGVHDERVVATGFDDWLAARGRQADDAHPVPGAS